MLAYFNAIDDTNMVELEGTTEPNDYKGKTLLERLNYWLITNNKDGIYLSWRLDTEKGYPVLVEKEI